VGSANYCDGKTHGTEAVPWLPTDSQKRKSEDCKWSRVAEYAGVSGEGKEQGYGLMIDRLPCPRI